MSPSAASEHVPLPMGIRFPASIMEDPSVLPQPIPTCMRIPRASIRPCPLWENQMFPLLGPVSYEFTHPQPSLRATLKFPGNLLLRLTFVHSRGSRYVSLTSVCAGGPRGSHTRTFFVPRAFVELPLSARAYFSTHRCPSLAAPLHVLTPHGHIFLRPQRKTSR